MSDIEVATDSFAEILDGLVRGEPNEFLHLLNAYDVPLRLEDSKTTVRTHFVAVDANGLPAIELLATAMARAAMDFCIPRSRIEQALKNLQETGSTSHFSRLEQQARELFVDGDGTGEGGELLLFLLMEQVLQLPQLLAKMSLKKEAPPAFGPSVDRREPYGELISERALERRSRLRLGERICSNLSWKVTNRA